MSQLGDHSETKREPVTGSQEPPVEYLAREPEFMRDVYVPAPKLPGELVLEKPPVFRRHWRWPVLLFLLTCISTFIAGATQWTPHEYLLSEESPLPLRRTLLMHAGEGLLYMVCLLSMLMAHEMGHFLATVYYGIPASFPYFLPLPITPIGTLGAVIRMDSREADRRQMFDIGIAGPLAGLVIAVPLLILGTMQLDFTSAEHGSLALDLPLAARWLVEYLQPRGFQPGQTAIAINHVNPLFMAGWVGLLVTALNMMPVGQLDGGHITYTLFGRWAHLIARLFMLVGVLYMVYFSAYQMALMAFLIFLIGIDHPPTNNDRVPLGWFRYVLGCCSLVIPVLCLSPVAIIQR
jgi:Zn-dependent protease